MATDDDLAALRARIAQSTCIWCEGKLGCAVCGSDEPTPDPRDARIAVLRENYDRLAHAYCRVVGIAPDEPISDAGHEAWQLVAHEAAVRGVRHENARIAELEAALREMVSSFEHAVVDHLGDRPGFQDDALAAARRALGEETSGG